ncbi:VOC family protein [Actinoplanes sp. NPDC049596]|uniref:VOC family protein n=1 Tax=unclassified Actinoplanes TaxID=2626549 RepID=UPI003429DFEC
MLPQTLRRATHPMAQFDGLALDTADPDRSAAFWAVALGGRAGTDADDRPLVRPGPGRPAREIMRLRATGRPEPDGGRVHADLRLPGSSPKHLLAAGAQMIRPPGADPWYVLADPEGNEFCAYPAVDDRPPGMFQLVIKCTQPRELAHWWADVLGGTVVEEGEAAAVVGAPEFPWDFMVFDPVPGIERFRSRVRWQVVARDHDLAGLLAAGARVRVDPKGKSRWWVLADPCDNEFCVTF